LLAELRPKGRKRVLLKRLDDEEDGTVKAYLIRALNGVEMDKEVWEKLRQSLVDQSVAVREAALGVLALQPEPLPGRFVEPVRKALKAPSAQERAAAVKAAKRFKAGRKLMMSAAADKHSLVQEKVAESLVGYEFDAALQEQLIRFCRADNRFVRRASSETLVAYARDGHGNSVVKLTLQLLKSDRSTVRCEAIWLLGTLKSDAGFPEVFEHAAKTPGAFNETYLTHKEAVVENRMVAWLVRRNEHRPASARMLTYALQDKDDLLRVHANRAIAALDYKEAVPALSKALLATERKGKEVFFLYAGIGRAEALRTLGKLATPKAFETIEKLLQSTSPIEQFKHLEILCEALIAHDYKQVSDLLGELILSPPTILENDANVLWLYSDTLYALTGNRVTPEVDRPDTEKKHESHFFLNVKD
jgi:HEAT repeat protein